MPERFTIVCSFGATLRNNVVSPFTIIRLFTSFHFVLKQLKRSILEKSVNTSYPTNGQQIAQQKFCDFKIKLSVKKDVNPLDININFNNDWNVRFLERLAQDGPWSDFETFKLAYEAQKHLQIPDFHGLLAPSYLPALKPFQHQLEAAQTVIEQMNGKAILADEVGLGKTIEAGLVLKEYMIRGLVKKALILVPASLVSQWASELTSKFYIPAIPQKKRTFGNNAMSLLLQLIPQNERHIVILF